MSAPTIPSMPGGSVAEHLLTSVALEEVAFAHLVNAEAEKVQRLSGTMPPASNFEDVLKLQKTVLAVLNVLVLKEMLLLDKVEGAKRLRMSHRCPKPPRFWRTHCDDWPVDCLELGCEEYCHDELVRLLEMPPSGHASLVLARQLIASKLSIKSGSDAVPISATIGRADELLCELPGKLPCGKLDHESRRPMVALAHQLEAYNHGHLTPDCTPEE